MTCSPSLEWLSREYHDLNGNHIEVLETPPTALEFARSVKISRPIVIKTSAREWSNDFLISEMGSRLISVAATPNGRADAVTRGPDGKLYFVEPAVEKITMESLLANLSAEAMPDLSDAGTYYLQSQNGNVYSTRFFEGQDDPSEFEALRLYIPSEVKWCTEALDRAPDAVNLWIGDGSSVSSIHSDPYENIYTVVRGQKHFLLLPPTDGYCLHERFYPHATYARKPHDSELIVQPSSKDTPPVRWASLLQGRLPPEAHPIHVTLSENETLYIPVGWYHQVEQAGITIAINWWYDTEMRGMNWVMLSYLRAIKEVPNTDEHEENEGMDKIRRNPLS
ncbi:Clavaminate synthase-like protein [Rhodocollybia butyracea]|uniref:Clavaminate synthase-like protein n=1 Tax=Rhodocollybia butyracea TaxID=206335 RepID=A0A9P5Q654_9AGAR|nr:Clavaminate synthase-like protein [Rhodocollybia butyracea]